MKFSFFGNRQIIVVLLLLLFTSDVTSSSSSSLCFSDDHPDRVSHLPGWNQPLPSKWYSGYLDYEFQGQQIHTHYILIQAEDIGNENDYNNNSNDNDNGDKPLIYWSNGGPGASSAFGLFTELGPLIFSELSLETQDYKMTGIPTPIYNPYGWTRFGSLLIIDQPAPVGFSYCNDDTNSSTSCSEISWTDELASQNAYLALQTFYQDKFPCLLEHETQLYLTGESYGGIYIPTLAREIVRGNNNNNNNNEEIEKDVNENDHLDGNLQSSVSNVSTKKTTATMTIPLQGFAVGDGCLGTQTSICGDLSSTGFVDYWHALFMAGHHQIPWKDFYILMRACHHAGQPGFLTSTPTQQGDNNNSDDDDDEKCRKALEEIKKELGGFFEYSLYDECTYQNGLMNKQKGRKQMYSPVPASSSSTTTTTSQKWQLQGGLNDYPCGGGMVMLEYLKLDSVQKALGVQSDFFEVDNAEGFDYTPTEPDLTSFYKEINGKLKVLIYNGDTDPAITSFAAQNWTSHMGFTEEEHWRPWTVDGCRRTGGYVTKYEGQFDFLTIRGAGHMVPTYKPEATFTFMKAWIQQGGDYPIYDANCTAPTKNVATAADASVDVGGNTETEVMTSLFMQPTAVDNGDKNPNSKKRTMNTNTNNAMLRG